MKKVLLFFSALLVMPLQLFAQQEQGEWRYTTNEYYTWENDWVLESSMKLTYDEFGRIQTQENSSVYGTFVKNEFKYNDAGAQLEILQSRGSSADNITEVVRQRTEFDVIDPQIGVKVTYEVLDLATGVWGEPTTLRTIDITRGADNRVERVAVLPNGGLGYTYEFDYDENGWPCAGKSFQGIEHSDSFYMQWYSFDGYIYDQSIYSNEYNSPSRRKGDKVLPKYVERVSADNQSLDIFEYNYYDDGYKHTWTSKSLQDGEPYFVMSYTKTKNELNETTCVEGILEEKIEMRVSDEVVEHRKGASLIERDVDGNIINNLIIDGSLGRDKENDAAAIYYWAKADILRDDNGNIIEYVSKQAVDIEQNVFIRFADLYRPDFVPEYTPEFVNSYKNVYGDYVQVKPTAIGEVEGADGDGTTYYYSLDGKRVMNPTKGTYICKKPGERARVVIKR